MSKNCPGSESAPLPLRHLNLFILEEDEVDTEEGSIKEFSPTAFYEAQAKTSCHMLSTVSSLIDRGHTTL